MNLLKDNVPKLVRKLAVPAMVGTLFQTLYNIVDTFFAGKISPEALSALSKSFPIYFIIIATSIGVTVAGTSLIGNSIGEKNNKKIIIQKPLTGEKHKHIKLAENNAKENIKIKKASLENHKNALSKIKEFLKLSKIFFGNDL